MLWRQSACALALELVSGYQHSTAPFLLMHGHACMIPRRPHTQPGPGMSPSKIVKGEWQNAATQIWADACKCMLGLQSEVSVPIVLDAIIEQVSQAAAGQSLLAAAQAADQEAAAAAALEAAFPSNSISAVDTHAAIQAAEVKPQSTRTIIYAGDSVGSAAAGIVTGTLWLTAAAALCSAE